MTQGGRSWTTRRTVHFHGSSGNKYNGTPYRRSWSAAADDWVYEPITIPLYTGYDRAYLSFTDEQDSRYTLYDSTDITASGGGDPVPEWSDPITVLAQEGTASAAQAQNLAFDLDDYDYDWEA